MPAIPEGARPDGAPPRYPRPVTLATLDEPPAPQPRSPSEERADVAAARTVLELASARAANSDSLDDYFARVKHRFGLAQLGYEGDFRRGFKVVGKINPELVLEVKEPISGTGIPADGSDRHKTVITHESGRLGLGAAGTEEVGIRMIADPLGPDHPQGTGPGGQDVLMGLLPTDPGIHKDADARYIRGHLLNDNLGGLGRPMNLYPITAKANSAHHAGIEKDLKSWVNDSRYWTRYEVTIAGADAITDENGTRHVNATMVAEASVLDTTLRPVSGLTRRVSIRSEFGRKHDADPLLREDAAALEAHRARPIDEGVEVRLSARHGDAAAVVFPGEMEDLLKRKIAQRGRAEVARRLRGYSGFGPRAEEVLFAAYDEVKRRSDKTVTGLAAEEAGILTRIRNAWSRPGDALKDRL
ncbi:hypothetical protein ICN82_16415 [Mangrovicoccus sp. HB182678]|uniref:Uncharacterized protein n=1 Tax=Mangrovicoccus algicola TaxID=2771008 RepID=A0A8J6YXX9_9RHOB|nr:hypothetical protein [Mangrovicoccus algicola]